MFFIFHPSVFNNWWTLGTLISTFVFTTWWTLGTVISTFVFTTWWTLRTEITTSVFYKLPEESYIRHGKLDSSIMLTLFSIVLIRYVCGWWFWVSLVYAIWILHPTQSINWSNFERNNDIVIHCDTWELLIFLSFSIRHSSSICWYPHHPILFLIVEPIGFREDPWSQSLGISRQPLAACIFLSDIM